MYHELLNHNHIFLLWNSPILRTWISWVIKTKGCSCRPCNHWWADMPVHLHTPWTCIRPLDFTCQSFPCSVCIFFVLVCLTTAYIGKQKEFAHCIPQFLFILWAKNTSPKRSLGKPEFWFSWTFEIHIIYYCCVHSSLYFTQFIISTNGKLLLCQT